MKSKQNLLGNHQRSWVWGRRLLVEILDAQRWEIAELVLSESLPTDEISSTRARAETIAETVRIEPSRRLTELCHNRSHQGYLARMKPFPYASISGILSILDCSKNKGVSSCPLFVILDSIQDSFNFGAIARSADALAVDAIFIGESNQAEVNSQVARSSAGAVCRVPIARTDNLASLTMQLKERDVCIVAANEKAETDCWNHDFRAPNAVIIGNEGSGISNELLDLCDAEISIPQEGSVGSLNAAAAAATIFYEAKRQNAGS